MGHDGGLQYLPYFFIDYQSPSKRVIFPPNKPDKVSLVWLGSHAPLICLLGAGRPGMCRTPSFEEMGVSPLVLHTLKMGGHIISSRNLG